MRQQSELPCVSSPHFLIHLPSPPLLRMSISLSIPSFLKPIRFPYLSLSAVHFKLLLIINKFDDSEQPDIMSTGRT